MTKEAGYKLVPLRALTLELLAARSPVASAYLIGIDGMGGSGKSYLAYWISQEMGKLGHDVGLMHLDDFYLPSDQRPANPSDSGELFDWRRLERQVLKPLSSGCHARYQRYDWSLDSVLPTRETVHSNQLVIVEGVTALRRELVGYYTAGLFVECAADVRLARGVERDGQEALELWRDFWIPAEERYIREHRPDLAADYVVAGAGPNPQMGYVQVQRVKDNK